VTQPVVDQAVLYMLSPYDVRAVNDQQARDTGAVAGVAYPAVVSAVPEGPVTPASTADLLVTIAVDVEYAATNRAAGDGQGYWSPPPEWS
jgi:hypothetical protein